MAARFNELKYCERMEELCKDTWMRLMYISSYKVQGGKEAVLHRQASASRQCMAWHTPACLICDWEARPAKLSRDLACGLRLSIQTRALLAPAKVGALLGASTQLDFADDGLHFSDMYINRWLALMPFRGLICTCMDRWQCVMQLQLSLLQSSKPLEHAVVCTMLVMRGYPCMQVDHQGHAAQEQSG